MCIEPHTYKQILLSELIQICLCDDFFSRPNFDIGLRLHLSSGSFNPRRYFLVGFLSMGSTDDEKSHKMVPDSNTSAPGTAKFSFSLPSKPSARSRPNQSEEKAAQDDEEKPEFLSEFDPNKPVAKKLKVIPKLENSWRPEHRMKNIKMIDSQLQFEPEVQATGIEPEVDYGLNLRTRVPNSANLDQNGKNNGEEDFMSTDEAEQQKLREDLQELPDEASLDAYDSLPVEDFGAALLRGMGWAEGKGIGRAKEPVKPIEYVRRVGREGLGATPAPPQEKPTKFLKPGDTREGRKDLVAATGPDGRTRNFVRVGEKLVERQRKGVAVGKIMCIVDGRHIGLRGEVIEVLGNGEDPQKVVMRLSKSEEKVVVRIGEVADMGSLEEENCLKRVHWDKEGSRNDRDRSERGLDYRTRDEKIPECANAVDEKIENSARHVKRDSGSKDDKRADYVRVDERERDYRSRDEKRADCIRRDERGSDYRSRDEKGELGHRYEREADHDGRNDEKDRSSTYGRRTDSGSRDDRREEERERQRKHLDVQSDKGDRSERDYKKQDYDRHGRKERNNRGDGMEQESGRGRDSRDRSGRRETESGRMRESRDNNWRNEKAETKKERKVEEDRISTKAEVRNDEKKSKSKIELKERISEPSWLMSHIRVRIISKNFKGGRLYLKKGRVLDVVDPTTCDLLMDENGEVVQGVKQDILETALPKRGGLILVVDGKHKGILGKLVERDSDKGVGLVQKEDNCEMVTLRLDYIAEFIGEPNDMGY
eukprot:Gb_22526 [translate_table: standard]